MKRLFLLGITLTTISYMSLSHADFSFRSPNSNACASISGSWIGTAHASNWFMECNYNGTVTISEIASDSTFTVVESGDKKSGSLFCPEHESKQFEGNCIDGQINIITNYGDLSGTFSENSGAAKGALLFGAGITLDVDITLQRAG